MTNLWRRVLAGLTHTGPGYDLPTQAETDLRAALHDLADRWEHHSTAIDPGLPKELFVEANTGQQWATTIAHTYRTAAFDLRDALRTGLPPHDLMTDAELEQYGAPKEAAS